MLTRGGTGSVMEFLPMSMFWVTGKAEKKKKESVGQEIHVFLTYSLAW
jgi:hypothetical protein